MYVYEIYVCMHVCMYVCTHECMYVFGKEIHPVSVFLFPLLPSFPFFCNSFVDFSFLPYSPFSFPSSFYFILSFSFPCSASRSFAPSLIFLPFPHPSNFLSSFYPPDLVLLWHAFNLANFSTPYLHLSSLRPTVLSTKHVSFPGLFLLHLISSLFFLTFTSPHFYQTFH